MPKANLHIPESLQGGVFIYVANQHLQREPHTHDELELNLVTSGKGVYIINERRFELTPRSLLWLFPDQDHVLADASGDFEMWVVVFRPDLVSKAAEESGLSLLTEGDPPGWFCRHLNRSSAVWLERLLSEVRTAQDNPALLNHGLSHALLSAWSHYQQAESSPDYTEVHPAVEKAVRLLQNTNPPPDLNETAQAVGLSASRLCRLFRRQIGVNMVDFRNRIRVERFLKIYGMGQRCNMLSAALDAGFGSYPQFYRAFRKIMGCGPGEYRSRQIN